jgi:hypothetical protein
MRCLIEDCTDFWLFGWYIMIFLYQAKLKHINHITPYHLISYMINIP